MCFKHQLIIFDNMYFVWDGQNWSMFGIVTRKVLFDCIQEGWKRSIFYFVSRTVWAIFNQVFFCWTCKIGPSLSFLTVYVLFTWTVLYGQVGCDNVSIYIFLFRSTPTATRITTITIAIIIHRVYLMIMKMPSVFKLH